MNADDASLNPDDVIRRLERFGTPEAARAAHALRTGGLCFRGGAGDAELISFIFGSRTGAYYVRRNTDQGLASGSLVDRVEIGEFGKTIGIVAGDDIYAVLLSAGGEVVECNVLRSAEAGSADDSPE